jgi:hypothetical protein
LALILLSLEMLTDSTTGFQAPGVVNQDQGPGKGKPGSSGCLFPVVCLLPIACLLYLLRKGKGRAERSLFLEFSLLSG